MPSSFSLSVFVPSSYCSAWAAIPSSPLLPHLCLLLYSPYPAGNIWLIDSTRLFRTWSIEENKCLRFVSFVWFINVRDEPRLSSVTTCSAVSPPAVCVPAQLSRTVLFLIFITCLCPDQVWFLLHLQTLKNPKKTPSLPSLSLPSSVFPLYHCLFLFCFVFKCFISSTPSVHHTTAPICLHRSFYLLHTPSSSVPTSQSSEWIFFSCRLVMEIWR